MSPSSGVGAARMVVSGLEGSMLVARPYGDIAGFQSAAANLLDGQPPADGQPLVGQAPAGQL